ncbi:acyl-CoA dehydrogenase family protein [Pseudomonas sp. YQ_6]|jgi:alkylation response protein AidB-like acyl-CoA dehydrogenase|uniref:acyl-CoA dehydrogenase family protein n=1 Tax=Pseudomonas TaxID=286 RepID=UPI0001F31FD4|nr:MULTISPECIES: acyl-CoA dehydrogenase family protein [Pseudomonas]HBK48165.1 acyl-CoA dehydrogenase [Pseudomonas sp.]ADR60067.1 Putative acyl-CoA dehydrogenase [Pseudomonas putida BIRD-1]AOX09464.1 acyl-CoA dehydrogenase [Pseudomonas putida JB]MCI1024583.1 acyl-CoA dehydrogenase family protein [Pseudomonas putida]MDW2777480.1 acyl-CoA dehydrogenase family protein [Pseudomonas sp. BEA3.1]
MSIDWNSLPDEEFRALFRSWVLENCPPELRYLRKQRPVYEEVRQWYQALADKGWLAPVWPRAYGGMGLTPAKHMIYVEEWGRLGCPRIPDHGISLTGPLLIHHGSEAQKAEFLPKIISGEHIWCQGYSEPNAGSDLASLRTSAVLDGDAFVVNGQKIWTTLAHCANWIFVLVRTDRDAKPQKGISVLLVDMTSPGVEVRTIENLRGEADFCEVFFDNVRVPARNLVGSLNEGWTLAKSVLGHERIFLGSPTRAEYALDRLDKLASDRGAFDDPAFVSRYARLRLDLYDLGSSYERYAKVLRSGGELGADVSVLKIFATELYQRITEEMLTLAQEEARYNDDLLIEGGQIDVMNLFLDARAPAIFGGSNEIQRNILAKAVLGLPS